MSDILSYNQALKNTNILTTRRLENRQIVGFVEFAGNSAILKRNLFNPKFDKSMILLSSIFKENGEVIASDQDKIVMADNTIDTIILWDGGTDKFKKITGVFGDKQETVKVSNFTISEINGTPFYDFQSRMIFFTSLANHKRLNANLSPGSSTSIYVGSTDFSACNSNGIIYYIDFYNRKIRNDSINVALPITPASGDRIVAWYDKIYLIDASNGDFYSFDTNTNTWSSKLGTIAGYPTLNANASQLYQSIDGYAYFGYDTTMYRWKIGTTTLESLNLGFGGDAGYFPIWG